MMTFTEDLLKKPTEAQIAEWKEEEQRQWEKTIQEYVDAPHVFYNSWHYLAQHPIFEEVWPSKQGITTEHVLKDNRFVLDLWMHVAKVNPETNSIDDDESKNTKVEVWLEHGPWINRGDDTFDAYTCAEEMNGYHTHDPDLDCGRESFNKAIVELAKLVRDKYGDDRSRI